MKTTHALYGIGFDQLFRDFDQAQKQNESFYPPHNVVKVDDEQYLIELAVAGFDSNELHIETLDNSLVVSAERTVKDNREYAYKGISARKFTRKFTLAEYVHVSRATLINGVLCITLQKVIPEEKKPKVIPIS